MIELSQARIKASPPTPLQKEGTEKVPFGVMVV